MFGALIECGDSTISIFLSYQNIESMEKENEFSEVGQEAISEQAETRLDLPVSTNLDVKVD